MPFFVRINFYNFPYVYFKDVQNISAQIGGEENAKCLCSVDDVQMGFRWGVARL
jgi:hypothetical protein